MSSAKEALCGLHLFILLIFLARSSGQPLNQLAKLVGSDGTPGPQAQGSSVALCSAGNLVAIGAPVDNNLTGAVWVFAFNGASWIQQGSKLVGTDSAPGSSQGFSVALSGPGDVLAVGGPYDLDSQGRREGATWVYIRNGNRWIQSGSKLVGNGGLGGSQQGVAVSLSLTGDILAVGGNTDDNFRGAVWIFLRTKAEKDTSSWVQTGSKLVGSDSSYYSMFGCSLSFSSEGDILAIGGVMDENYNGAVWMFLREDANSPTWSQQGSKLVDPYGKEASSFGFSVVLSGSGSILLVGAPSYHLSNGSTWVFLRSQNTWQAHSNLIGSDYLIGAKTATQGLRVALSRNGNFAVTTGFMDDANNGAIWTFLSRNNTLTQSQGRLIASNEIPPSQLGSGVALSEGGDILAVGGATDDNNRGGIWIFGTEAPIPFSDDSEGEQLSPRVYTAVIIISVLLFCIGLAVLSYFLCRLYTRHSSSVKPTLYMRHNENENMSSSDVHIENPGDLYTSKNNLLVDPYNSMN